MASIKKYIVAITGASGADYGVHLIEFLLSRGHTVHLIISEAGWRVLKEEKDFKILKRDSFFSDRFADLPGTLSYHPFKDIGSSIASGSNIIDGMIIVPCSMGTLSRIANGNSGNLIERAADVILKEQRKLIVVPRETPLNLIHLENMTKLSKLGVSILPAMPAFYQKPKTIDDIIDFIVGKILDLINIEHNLYRRWS